MLVNFFRTNSEKENEMIEGNSEKVKKKVVWPKRLFIFIFLITVGFVGGAMSSYNFVKSSVIDPLMEEHKELDSKFMKQTEIVTELKHQLDLERSADRTIYLKNDIHEYIRANFKKVPRSVAKTISTEIVEKSKQYSVSPELLVGIVQVESAFDPMAVSSKSARGLMQVMPAWAEKFSLPDEYELHNIDINIESGIKVFQIHQEEASGNIEETLYLYVGKDKSYAPKVFMAMGQFVSFRSMIEKEEVNGNGHYPEQELVDESKPKPGTVPRH